MHVESNASLIGANCGVSKEFKDLPLISQQKGNLTEEETKGVSFNSRAMARVLRILERTSRWGTETSKP
jgi:hypothetical protein